MKETNWTLIEQLLPVMQKLATATKVLCHEALPTISSYFPLVFRILNYVKIDEIDNAMIGEFKTRIKHGLRDRLLVPNFWLSSPMIATVLDLNL